MTEIKDDIKYVIDENKARKYEKKKQKFISKKVVYLLKSKKE